MPDDSITASKNTVFKSKYFRVDQCDFVQGAKTFTKDVIVRIDTVLIVPITQANEIFLVSEYRDIYGKKLLEVIGGKMNMKHTPLENAKRELQEETGIMAKAWKHIATWNLNANMLSTMHVFTAKELTFGKAQPDEDEDIQLIKLPFTDILRKIQSGELSLAPSIAALYLVNSLLDKNEL